MSNIAPATSLAPTQHILPLPQVLALAEQHRQAGRLQTAEELCRQILNAVPGHAETLHLLGIIAHQAGNPAAAIELLRQAIASSGRVALYHCNLGEMCRLAGRLDEALAAGRQALALQPAYPEALNNLGIAHYDLGEYDEAAAHYRRAIDLAPGYAQAHSNLGNALRALRRLDAAIPAYTRALELQPAFADAFSNRALTYHLLARFDEAVADFRRAIALEPLHGNAHTGLAMNHLLRGRLAEGFVEYEWRWRSSELPSRPPMATPWRGEDPRGKRLLIHAEQGLGDTLHFCRYLPLLRERGARLVLNTQGPLRSLIGTAMPWLEIIADGENLPTTDAQCALLSLPHLLGTTFDTIPATIPYLHAKPDDAARFAAIVGNERKLKVGIVWAGSRKHLNDVDRTIAPSTLAPILSLEAVRFFSLQIGARQDDLLPDHVTDLGPKLTDFAQTAGALAALDLLITVDTAPAHLAGAMGKPAWLLLPFVPDWRWLLEREDSPWYPTLRLFRQKTRGNWHAPINDVAQALNDLAQNGQYR
ncbi:MAG: glycosyltransferase family protein [Hyphomicrobiales bacterium]|nr:glycosyltransferase family protein [Hyphomicrobiales bacterium]MBV9741451.1 glycosyltransferase family protein [Hyphomicrobiales bacterium]